jgi:hypothetical protein
MIRSNSRGGCGADDAVCVVGCRRSNDAVST